MRQQPRSRHSQALLVVAFILGGMIIGVAVALDQFILEDGFASDTAPAASPSTTPASAAVSPTEDMALQPDSASYPSIFIPDAGVSEFIIESRLEPDGWRVHHLGNRVGHLEGTSQVGEGGNIVLAGHVENSDGDPSIFARIGELEIGQPVVIAHGTTEYSYLVTEVKTVPADDMSVIYSTSDNRVTLITCTGYNIISDRYDERIVVVAQQVP